MADVRRLVLICVSFALLFSYQNCGQLRSITSAAKKDSTSNGGVPDPVPPESTIPTAAGYVGGVSFVTFDGVVQGWAKDNANPNAKVTVVFHINDTGVGMGTSIGTQTADQNGLVSTSSPAYQHSFAFTLPDVYRNGKPHTVNVYAYTATAANMLPTGSKAYTAYAQTVAGKNYFDTTVKPAAMTSCGNCHIIDYNAQYQALSYPAPFNGGTATNNSLIGHPAGLISHPGGNVCGGVNGNPCSLFQQWWKLEFEQP